MPASPARAGGDGPDEPDDPVDVDPGGRRQRRVVGDGAGGPADPGAQQRVADSRDDDDRDRHRRQVEGVVGDRPETRAGDGSDSTIFTVSAAMKYW